MRARPREAGEDARVAGKEAGFLVPPGRGYAAPPDGPVPPLRGSLKASGRRPFERGGRPELATERTDHVAPGGCPWCSHLVHIALREALVNTIIHADYGEGGAILVIKRPDLFGFRNPGTLRIRKEDAIRGGTMNSDCRNRNLQKMFQMIGYADQAGSGFPKIYSGWASQDWKTGIPGRFQPFANLSRLADDVSSSR